MSAAAKPPKNATETMRITDTQLVEAGDNQGDLVIAVEATRGGKKYRLPYQIKRHNIPNVSLDYLKQRVRQDMDAHDEMASKENAVVDKLAALKGKTINLD